MAETIAIIIAIWLLWRPVIRPILRLIVALLHRIFHPTPCLHSLAEQGDVNSVGRLLASNAVDVNQRDRAGRTSLMLACGNGHLAASSRLLDAGADPNVRDQEGNSAMTYALGAGHLNVFDLLIQRGADINARQSMGLPLVVWVSVAEPHLVRELVNRGADVNARGDKGETLLIAAVAGGDVELVRFALDKGADVNARDKDGYSAILTATGLGPEDAWKEIDDISDFKTADALDRQFDRLNQYSEIVKALLVYGADIEATDPEGRTALMLSARMGNLQVVQILLDKKANVNAIDRAGWTTLMHAAYPHLHIEPKEAVLVIKALLAHGADLAAKNGEGKTALFLAEDRARFSRNHDVVAEALRSASRSGK